MGEEVFRGVVYQTLEKFAKNFQSAQSDAQQMTADSFAKDFIKRCSSTPEERLEFQKYYDNLRDSFGRSYKIETAS